jgi:hypothetical protein
MTARGEPQPTVDALVERGERDGCVRESEIELAQRIERGDLVAWRHRLASRSV